MMLCYKTWKIDTKLTKSRCVSDQATVVLLQVVIMVEQEA